METTPNGRVRQARVAAGLSQAALAKAIGVSQPSITWMEKDGNRLTERTVAQIADACNVRVNWILTGEEPMEAQDHADRELRALCERLLKGEADSFRSALIGAMAKLSDSECERLADFALSLAEAVRLERERTRTPEEEAAEEAKRYYEQVLKEKKAAAESGASTRKESEGA